MYSNLTTVSNGEQHPLYRGAHISRVLKAIPAIGATMAHHGIVTTANKDRLTPDLIRVTHFTAPVEGQNPQPAGGKGIVRTTTLTEFLDEEKSYRIFRYPINSSLIRGRVFTALKAGTFAWPFGSQSMGQYCPLTNNCEDFALCCVYRQQYTMRNGVVVNPTPGSKQVRRAQKLLAGATVIPLWLYGERALTERLFAPTSSERAAIDEAISNGNMSNAYKALMSWNGWDLVRIRT